MLKSIKSFINPDPNPLLVLPEQQQALPLPTLWLLGKTGAGKSSLIQALTQLDEVEVGNGFAPCTKTSDAWDFPQEKPILRFLDTRGVGEAGYDPSEDLNACSAQSHALLVIAKVNEPEQSAVIEALKKIRKERKVKHVLVVHTAVKSVAADEQERQQAYNQQQFEKAWGNSLLSIGVDFDCDAKNYVNRSDLVESLAKMLPIVGVTLTETAHATAEEKNFKHLQAEILWYAGVASASDLLPAVGLVSVPVIQAKMLHSLANQYGVEWGLQTFSELAGVLGTSFGVQYGMQLGTRQLGKLIPGYGQTVGAVAAATVSFSTSYGLGRAACYYFHRKSRGEMPDRQEIQQIYREALDLGKRVATHG